MPATITEEIFCEPFHYRHYGTAGLAWCEGCRAWHHNDYGCTVTGQPGEDEAPQHCDECDDYHGPYEMCKREWCGDCSDWHERDRWGNVVLPEWYCSQCSDYHDHGEDCPGWYCSACGDYHDHDSECPNADCYCEAPRQIFSVPNDGQPRLSNDERATVHLAAGIISDEGLREIGYYLRQQAREGGAAELVNVSYGLEEIGNMWQAKNGNYTKRLSAYAYKSYGVKIPSDVLSRVGNIAREHSTAADVEVEVTRDLNMSAEDFYHEDSCWWGSYSESRCALKTNGGFGLRSFDDDGGVTGRAWVMPLRRDGDGPLAPTFDTDNPDALIVFNGYGKLSGYAAARVMAAMYGWTYKKISFECEPMYVNAGGYIVGPEDIVHGAGSLFMSVSRHANLYEKELQNVA